MKKVVVAGAGIGGLVAAGLLARRGCQVTVLERSPILGGRSHVLSKDGFALPYGAHALLAPKAEPMASIFKELGVTLKLNKPAMSKFKLFSGGRILPSPLSLSAFTTPAIDGFFHHFVFFRKFVQMVKAQPRFDSHFTVQKWLDENVKEPSIAKVMRAYAQLMVYDGALDRYSMNAFAELANVEYSTTQPLGYIGFDDLIAQLKRVLESAGGVIFTGREVKQLVIDERRIAGVVTEDGTVTADAVILNLPPQAIGKLVHQHTELSDELDPILQQPAQYVYVHDVLLNKRIRRDVANVLDLDDSVYVNDYSLNVPGSAPADKQLLTALRFLTAEEQHDDAHIDHSRQSVESVLHSVYPGWRNHLAGTRIVKRAIVGGIARHAGHRLLPLASKSVQSLYFAGDSAAGKGALSLPAYDSAWRVADFISHASRLNKAMNE